MSTKTAAKSSGPKKQGTRMVKLSCVAMWSGAWSAFENAEADAADAAARVAEKRERFFESIARGGRIPGLCFHGQRPGECGACIPER